MARLKQRPAPADPVGVLTSTGHPAPAPGAPPAVGPRSSGRDRGTTLAELVVSMLVFGVFGTVLATTVVQATRLARESATRETTAQRASLLIEQVTKDLRTAVSVGSSASTQTAFTAAQPGTVSFFSSVAPEVLRERLFVQGGALRRERQRPDDAAAFPNLTYTDPTRTTVSRLGPSDLSHTVTFGYLLKGSATAVPVVADLAGLQAIVAVTVRVSVDGDGAGGLDPVVLQSTVRPYNG